MPVFRSHSRVRTYEEWINAVNLILIANHGIGSDDGMDWASRASYEAGLSPKQGAKVWEKQQRGC